jgi:glutamate racemase
MQPIGIFDSGYGGLTVMKEIVKALPNFDYIYLGDNARAPYGPRSFDTVYKYTLQAVNWFFEQNCPLVILACNTASAKALRSIQQNDLPKIAPDNRVLGVIRPTTEIIGNISKSKSIGILATKGTVSSDSYPIEIQKFFPDLIVSQEACPMWVPLIENDEYNNSGADYFIQKHTNSLISKNEHIDTVLLACTHYPIIADKIAQFLPKNIALISQGEIVANSLKDYLLRHPEMKKRITKGARKFFYTTDNEVDFQNHAQVFYGEALKAEHINLGA